MGDKSIKNDQVKKKKKTDYKPSAPSAARPVMTQPELIKKKKKDY